VTRIIGLQVENIKRLVAIDIKPTGSLVVISGRNAQGKSSVLDSIFWALASARVVQGVPIRRGENRARIRLDCGEIIVTRQFKKDAEGEVTTGVTVESEKGARFDSPQRMLDELLGVLCMDPLDFARLGGNPEGKRKQFKILQQFVPDYDFDEQDGLNKRDNEDRADLNKQWKQAQAAADLIKFPDDTPDKEQDEDVLVAQLTSAADKNAENAKRRENRKNAAAKVEKLKADIGLADGKLEVAIADAERSAGETIERLRKQIAAEENALRERISNLQAEDRQHRKEAGEEIERIEKLIREADEIPEDTDLALLRESISAARATNILVRRKIEQAGHVKKAASLKEKADALTSAMASRQIAKEKAIAAAKMPVPGLGFGDSEIQLNGLPFDQASDAERLRCSCAIAIAQNPKLRVMRIREGSLLDSAGMRIIDEMCEAHDFQAWVEVVTDGEPIGFVIEDGSLKTQPQAAEAEA
jgi:hypothetical protein